MVMALWQYLLILVVLLFLLTIMTVEIRIKYQRVGGNDLFVMHVYALRGLMGLRMEMPALELFKNCLRPLLRISMEMESSGGRLLFGRNRTIDAVEVEWQKLPKVWRYVKKIYLKFRPAIIYLLSHLQLNQFKWRTRFGLNDAAETGLGIGALWGLKGAIYAKVRSITGVSRAKPQVQVIPNFHQPAFATDFDCIFAIRTGHIIIAGINFIGCLLFRKA